MHNTLRPRCFQTDARPTEPEARPAGWLPMNEKHEDNLDRVWDIIEKVGVTMLTTQFPGGLRPGRWRRGRNATPA